MGIVLPEKCWARNKIWNKKKPLLHLVGILFPHINDDARSKSHQIRLDMLNVISQTVRYWTTSLQLAFGIAVVRLTATVTQSPLSPVSLTTPAAFLSHKHNKRYNNYHKIRAPCFRPKHHHRSSRRRCHCGRRLQPVSDFASLKSRTGESNCSRLGMA